MTPRVAIILLNWNGKQDTLECLASLDRLSFTNYTIFIADNGSRDDSISAFKMHYPKAVIIENHANLGFAEGNNRAIAAALTQGYEYILLLNNDTTVDPSLLDALLDMDHLYPKHILGGKIHLFSQRETLDHLGGIWNLQKGIFDLIGNRAEATSFALSTPIAADYVTGCCLFAHREIFEKVGLLDERFFLFWEESDLCFRAKILGYNSLVCLNAHVYHKVSASFCGGKPHVSYFFWRNRFLFAEKHVHGLQFLRLWICVFLPEIFKLFRHWSLKHLQYAIARCFRKTRAQKKREEIRAFKACLHGTCDYFLRQFYNGPSWIFHKK